MRITLCSLQSDIVNMGKELFAVWNVKDNSAESSMVYDNEWMEVKPSGNKYGLSIVLRRLQMTTFLSFNYRQIGGSVLKDHFMVETQNNNFAASAVTASLFKRHGVISQLIEAVRRRPQRSSLESTLHQDLKDVQKNIDRIKAAVRARELQNDIDGFTEVIVVPDDEEDTVVMSILPGVDSDFDSSEDDFEVACSKVQSELAALAARCLCDHIDRYNQTCCDTSSVMSNPVSDDGLFLSQQQTEVMDIYFFANVLMTSAYHHANKIREPHVKAEVIVAIDKVQQTLCRITRGGITNTVSREMNRSSQSQLNIDVDTRSPSDALFPSQSTSSQSSSNLSMNDIEDPVETERDALEVLSSFRNKTKRNDEDDVSIQPMSKKSKLPTTCIDIVEIDGLNGTTPKIAGTDPDDWWEVHVPTSGNSATTIDVKFSRCVLFVERDIHTYSCSDNNVSFSLDSEDDHSQIEFVDALTDVNAASTMEDEQLTDDETDVMQPNNIDKKVIKIRLFRKIMLKQAREMKLINDHELTRRKGMLAKLRREREDQEMEFKVRRDRVQQRHFKTFLDVSGLKPK